MFKMGWLWEKRWAIHKLEEQYKKKIKLLVHQEGWLYVIMDMLLQLEDCMQQEYSSEQFE